MSSRTGALSRRRYEPFATAQFASVSARSGEERPGPPSVVHAKRLGTIYTLCGRSSLSWFKFHDVLFDDADGDLCPQCVAVLGPNVTSQRKVRV